MSKDYYSILGVGRNASDDDIKSAYRREALAAHPDISAGNLQRMKDVNEAFEVLGRGGLRPEARKEYDEGLRRNKESGRGIFALPGEGRGFYGRAASERYVPQPIDPVICIPTNDIGLLSALYKAHQANEPGVWKVKRDPRNPKDHIPEVIYEVIRTRDGWIRARRVVDDWIELRKDRATPEELERLEKEGLGNGKLVDGEIFFGYKIEKPFFGILGKRRVELKKEFWRPEGAPQYYDTLFELARTLSERHTIFADRDKRRISGKINEFFVANRDLYTSLYETLWRKDLKEEVGEFMSLSVLEDKIVNSTEEVVYRDRVLPPIPEGQLDFGEKRI